MSDAKLVFPTFPKVKADDSTLHCDEHKPQIAVLFNRFILDKHSRRAKIANKSIIVIYTTCR